MEPVESLYKEFQWHTNEDQTMCEPKASIWWKTVHWSQCNSYEGMHRHIQMPSRYLTNGSVAQLVEHRAVTREVVSSTWAGPSLRVLK